MIFYDKLSVREQKSVLAEILTAYRGLSVSALELLIEKTSVKGVKFVKINDYQSAASGGTETANQLINIGASYQNMLTKDSNKYAEFDVNAVNVDDYNYETVNTGALTLDDYKQAVKNALPIALTELQCEKKPVDTSATIKLNTALSFNRNTCNLNIHGMQINKVVKEAGELKVVKSAPKTIAKKLIQKFADSRASKLRTFTIQNIASSIKINGSELLIN